MTKKEAIAHFGSATKLADLLGVSKQAVSLWGVIPDGRQAQIQILSGNKLLADPIRDKAA